MQYIKPITNDYLISATALKQVYNTSAETVKKWRQRCKFETYNTVPFFYLSTLPRTAQQTVDVERLQALQQAQSNSKEVEALKRSLEITARDYASYYNYIREQYGLKLEYCTDTAQKWAVWEWIINNYSKQAKTNFKDLHAAYVLIFCQHLTNYKSFMQYKTCCILNGIEQTVVDVRLHGTAKRRLSDAQYAFIRSLYMNDSKFTSPQVWDKLAEYCLQIDETPCSVESVKRYMYDVFEKDAECYTARYGEYAAKKRMPYASLIPAKYIHDQWQGDGWDVPLFVQTKDGKGNDKIGRLKVFPFIDNHSRKIIGYSIGMSENTVLIVEALEDAMRNTGVLPAEFVFDKHSYHKTDVAQRFRTETERRGIIWTVSTNPQRKAIVERYFQYLDGIIKTSYTGYIGQGITAKNKNARRNPETYTELRKTDNLLTQAEVKVIIADTILKYNSTPLPALGNISPNEAYANSKGVNAINITESERVSLINPPAEYKVTRAQITIKKGTVKHEFQLPANLYYLEGETVHVIYDGIEDGIYLFDIKTGECYGSVLPKQKIHGAIVNQTDKDRQYFNNLTGRKKGVKHQSSKTSKAIADKLLINSPEIADYIHAAHITKDVRTEMQQNKELHQRAIDLGVNINHLPVTGSMGAITPKNTNASPYIPKSHKPGAFDVNKFLNEQNDI